MSGKNISKTGWLKNPKLPRLGETIGGGFFVFRRGDGTKRIRPSQWPFEYATLEAAMARAEAHAIEQPGFEFIIVQEVTGAYVHPLPITQETEAA